METILGLDLGPTSVGWNLIQKGNGQTGNLIDGGVRIFSSVTEDKTGAPKNQKRRGKRGLRVNIKRRRNRRAALKQILVSAELLPAEVLDSIQAGTALNAISTNPYELRAQALNKPLADHELGRALLQLGMRRGFLSNRKAAKDSDSKKVGAAISELQAAMGEGGHPTLGAYLASLPVQRNHEVDGPAICNTNRAMYEAEFDAIWHFQSQSNSKLTNELKEKLHRCIFFQNPLRSQKHLVGKCTLESGKKRAAKWQPIAQTLRIWQDVSRIRTSYNDLPLNKDQQRKLVHALHRQKSMSWNSLRKLLGLGAGVQFNLESSGALKELKGNATEVDLTKALGDALDHLNESEQNKIKLKILNWLDASDNDEKLRAKIENGCEFSEPVVESLIGINLATGYFHLSVKACTNLVQVFETDSSPLTYRDAAEKAGYDMTEKMGDKDFLPPPPQLRNPIVEKALVELRKVVNAILRKHGRPDIIRLEMARDLKNTKKVRDEIQKHNQARAKARESAKEILMESFRVFKGMEPTNSDIEKYLLWKECCENEQSECPYTGTTISGDMLFTPDVEVEHIIPYSRSFDNSFNNKTLCMATENARKGNRTPYELYNGTGQYEDVLARVAKLPYPKRRRFARKEVPQNPDASRQLNDTRYICKAAKEFLQQTGIRVQVSNGRFTAAIREKWNLNSILNPDGVNRKNREDHRHHFIDAVVVANIHPAMVTVISTLCAKQRDQGVSLQRGIYGLKKLFQEPWNGFRAEVEAMAQGIIISHSPTRKVSGALHEDTALGRITTTDGFKYATRVALGKSMTPEKAEFIADNKVRELVLSRLSDFDNDPKKAFADLADNPLLHADGKTPIKRVRLHSKESTDALASRTQPSHAEPYAFYRKGNNYKVSLFEMPDGKWKGHYLTAFDAMSGGFEFPNEFAQAKFVMELCKNDLVDLAWNGGRAIFRVQMMTGANDKISFRLNHSNPENKKDRTTMIEKRSNTLKTLLPRRVEVSPLGEVAYVGSKPNH